MTPAELDERIEEYVDSHQYIDGGTRYVPREEYVPELKQLIRDCIEAVTPRRATEDDVNIPVDEGFSIVRNRTIDQLEANTKELLGEGVDKK